MNRLESRLRTIPGVSNLTIELTDDGLSSLSVVIDDGTDEATVLEDIRRILVAYGVRGGQNSAPAPMAVPPPASLFSPSHNPRSAVRTDDGPDDEGPEEESAEIDSDEQDVRFVMVPTSTGVEARVTVDGVTHTGRSDRSPLGAAEAMVKALVSVHGCAMPDRVGLDRSFIDDVEVVTVLLWLDGHCETGSAPINGHGYTDALLDACDRALVLLHMGSVDG